MHKLMTKAGIVPKQPMDIQTTVRTHNIYKMRLGEPIWTLDVTEASEEEEEFKTPRKQTKKDKTQVLVGDRVPKTMALTMIIRKSTKAKTTQDKLEILEKIQMFSDMHVVLAIAETRIATSVEKNDLHVNGSQRTK